MIVSASTQMAGMAPPGGEGKVNPARTVHGVSQQHSSEKKPQSQETLTSDQTVPGFQLGTMALSQSKKTEDSNTLLDEQLNTDSAALEVSVIGAQENPDLATQAQLLTQGMISIAEKQTQSVTKAISSLAIGEAKSVKQDQNGALLSGSLQQASLGSKEGLPSASTTASARLSISNADFQTLLSQPTQGQPTAAPLQMHSLNAQTVATASATTHAQAQGAEWAAVRVDTSAGKWGEQMMQVLHDRVTLQAQQNVQEAKIRLDPPDLGKLDLLVRVEGDRLSVHINANTAATREALMQVSERLRTELQEQNFVHVDVNVGSDQGQERHQHLVNEEDTTIFAARESGALQSKTTSYSEHWLNTQA